MPLDNFLRYTSIMIFGAITQTSVYFTGQDFVVIIVVVGIVAAAVASFRNRFKNETRQNDIDALTAAKALIDVQKEQLDNSKEEIKDLQDKHIQNQREIGELRGELKSLKEVPLRQISQALKQISDNQVLIAEHLGIDGFKPLK